MRGRHQPASWYACRTIVRLGMPDASRAAVHVVFHACALTTRPAFFVVLPRSAQTASGAALASMRAASRRILTVAASGAAAHSYTYRAQGGHSYDARRYVSRHRVASPSTRPSAVQASCASPKAAAGAAIGGRASSQARGRRGQFAWSM